MCLVCESLNLGVGVEVSSSLNSGIFLLKLVFPPLSKEMTNQTHRGTSQTLEPFLNSLIPSPGHGARVILPPRHLSRPSSSRLPASTSVQACVFPAFMASPT